jgi:hypothetical protein
MPVGETSLTGVRSKPHFHGSRLAGWLSNSRDFCENQAPSIDRTSGTTRLTEN